MTTPGPAPTPVTEFVAPRTAGSGTALGIILSSAVVGAGAVAVHDGLVGLGAIDGNSWLTNAARAVGRIDPIPALAWMSAGVAVIGLALIVSALLPRRRYGMQLVGDGGLYMREIDVARLSSGAARSTGRVLEATSSASRRRVVLRLRTTIDHDADDLARTSVAEHLTVLRDPPVVVVRSRRQR